MKFETFNSSQELRPRKRGLLSRSGSKILVLAALSLGLGGVAQNLVAQEINTIEKAIVESITNNPEVKASWYTFESSRAEQRVAKGRYYPSVDFTAQSGRIDSDAPQFGGDDYNATTGRLSVTQNLFRGFETRNLVNQLDKSKLASYFLLRDTSEGIALDAAVAYLDVLRFRRLVELAEENYVQHRLIYDDIQSRAQAGISRRVDFEQAEARLALAESNLLTETTNLHDVSVRFRRIVGVFPSENLTVPTIPASLIPTTRYLALSNAYENNPRLFAAAYSLEAAKAELETKNSPLYPTVDLRARFDKADDNNSLVTGAYDESAVEVVVSYNLFRGGSDSATKRQFYERVNNARELKDNECRNVTQLVSIAFNDINSLRKQRELLDRNQIATEKVRFTYRNQFDIGQRTLLDLLDTENEYFDVRRAYVNADIDLQIAQFRTLAASGRLIEAFNVLGLQNDAIQYLDLDQSIDGLSNHCSLISVPDIAVDRQQVLDKAIREERRRRQEARVVALPQDERVTRNADNSISFRLDVQYQNGSAQLVSSYDKDIKDAAEFLNSYENVRGIIEGHTDSVGSESYNLQLSQARADTLKSRLIADYNIAPSILTAKGYGEAVPIADNSTDAGRRKNRRVVLVIVPNE
ncbi:TolC family outer membrane protein [Aurantivibrio infirmus]